MSCGCVSHTPFPLSRGERNKKNLCPSVKSVVKKTISNEETHLISNGHPRIQSCHGRKDILPPRRHHQGDRHRGGGYHRIAEGNEQAETAPGFRFAHLAEGYAGQSHHFAQECKQHRAQLLHARLWLTPHLGHVHPRHRFAHQHPGRRYVR